MKFIDLCCGIGGFHQALSHFDFECVFACDNDKDCKENYEKNYNIVPHDDIYEIEINNIPFHDILTAGFPCQSFSKAGHRRGFDDNRGTIFFQICKIIKHHKPSYVILENVKNITSHDKGNTWSVMKEKIDQLGYYTYDTPIILNPLYYGVPQSRERVIIMCKRKDIGPLPPKPLLKKSTHAKKTDLKSILEKDYDKKYLLKGKLKITHEIYNEFLKILKNNNVSVPKFPIWTEWWKTDEELLVQSMESLTLTNENEYKKYKNWIDKNIEFYKQYKNILEDWLVKSRQRKEWSGAVRKMEYQAGKDGLCMDDILWSPRSSGVRIKKTDYSPTLVAMTSMIPIYGPEMRQLTPRECARLQSFPDSYIIHEDDKVSYKQFGNAVNVEMIKHCVDFLINDKQDALSK